MSREGEIRATLDRTALDELFRACLAEAREEQGGALGTTRKPREAPRGLDPPRR